MAGRKPILINLKATAPSGDVKFFSSFPEAAREMGFSEYGVRKAYHSKRNRIGEYELEWLEPIPKEEEPKPKPKKKPKPKTKLDKIKEAKTVNCFICKQPLTGRDRMNYNVFTIEELNKDGEAVSSSFPSSLYMASKETGISLGALRSARDKGNTLLTRRKDKKKFRVFWGTSHNICFQARRERKRKRKRERFRRMERKGKKTTIFSEIIRRRSKRSN